MSCQIDGDCAHLEGICVNKVCVLPNLEEVLFFFFFFFFLLPHLLPKKTKKQQVESQFLMCYITYMPSYLESFLKRNILPSNIGDFSKNSTEFYEGFPLVPLSSSPPLSIFFLPFSYFLLLFYN